MFTFAIVRRPARNFAEGLTTVDLGLPDYDLAMRQHEAYCAALETCGLTLTKLEPDPDYPDSCFVEDVAVITGGNTAESVALLTRPGATSRRGEVESMRSVLLRFFDSISETLSPGTLDGGDVCEAGNHFFIGISERTNEAGARQLAGWLKQRDRTSSFIDVGSVDGLLHLKSGIAYLGDNRLVVTEALAERPELDGYELLRVTAGEEYAANCVRINDYVLVAAGHPGFERELNALGYRTLALDMSEFQKMDGGLSCLSLRF